MHHRIVATAGASGKVGWLRSQTPTHPAQEPAWGSAALAQALEQLHADGYANMPAQRDEADVTGHDGRPQQVLHRRRAVRVAIENLWREVWADG